MQTDTKIFIGIGLLTVLLFGGIVWYSGQQNPDAPVEASVLVRDDSQIMKASETSTTTVTLVEFGDYQCPACAAVAPYVKKLVTKDFKGRINFVFRNYPLPQHPYALLTAESAEIAGDQGKFWEMYDIIYERQNEWVAATSTKETILGYAKTLGLDMEVFSKSLDENKYSAKINRDVQDGNSAGVDSTPSFFVNGKRVRIVGANDLADALTAALK